MDLSAYTPGSVPALRYRKSAVATIYLGRRYRRPPATYPQALDGPPCLLLGLAPGGVYLADAVTCAAGELLPRLFTLTAAYAPVVCFLWHCPAGYPGWLLAITLPCGARTFLERFRARRPAGRSASIIARMAAPRDRVVTMLIWLPPSEGKNAPACGPSLSLESLSRPCLTPDRRSVAEALVALGSGPEAAATLEGWRTHRPVRQ